MTARTKQNLNTAMLNKALTYAESERFAMCGQMNENRDLAKLFRNMAPIDRIDHLQKQFDLAVRCAGDLGNLKTAILDKSRQIDMYSEFATQARMDGDDAAAELFDRIREQEMTDLTAFAEGVAL